jgi:hypothetical protein
MKTGATRANPEKAAADHGLNATGPTGELRTGAKNPFIARRATLANTTQSSRLYVKSDRLLAACRT